MAQRRTTRQQHSADERMAAAVLATMRGGKRKLMGNNVDVDAEVEDVQMEERQDIDSNILQPSATRTSKPKAIPAARGGAGASLGVPASGAGASLSVEGGKAAPATSSANRLMVSRPHSGEEDAREAGGAENHASAFTPVQKKRREEKSGEASSAGETSNNEEVAGSSDSDSTAPSTNRKAPASVRKAASKMRKRKTTKKSQQEKSTPKDGRRFAKSGALIRHFLPQDEEHVRIPWSEEECNNLCEGVRTHDHHWAEILENFLFDRSRTTMQLKDKFRNLQRTNRIDRNGCLVPAAGHVLRKKFGGYPSEYYARWKALLSAPVSAAFMIQGPSLSNVWWTQAGEAKIAEAHA